MSASTANGSVIPRSLSEAAAALAGAAARKRPVRIVGGATKLGWGGIPPPDALQLQTAHLDRVVVQGDGETATLSAGTPLVRAQAILARSGRMFAADPHLGLGQRPAATVGGVIATADSGPLSHRYGPVRDQVIGITAAISDGTLIRTGPRSSAQQDGYDVAKLLTGSYGTLGVILTVDVRLRPLPTQTATALGSSADPDALQRAVTAIGAAHPGLEAFDVAWREGRGGLLAQLTGSEASVRAEAVAETMSGCGLEAAPVRAIDADLWARQRAGQRSPERAVMRVHARREELSAVLALADEVGATLVGRAALGIAYLALDVDRIAAARTGLPAGTPAVVTDIPPAARGAVDAWGVTSGPQLELMRAVKQRFDPAGICNPGIFVGSI